MNATPLARIYPRLLLRRDSRQESTNWTRQGAQCLDGAASGTTVEELFRNSVASSGARKDAGLPLSHRVLSRGSLKLL